MTSKQNEHSRIYREVSAIEFRGILNHTIPVCDEFGEFNLYGLAIVKKCDKYAVVNRKPAQVTPFARKVEILRRGIILTFDNNGYNLYNRFGKLLNAEPLPSKMQACAFARKCKLITLVTR